MKYYGIDFIDDFLYEKAISQGLSKATIDSYKPVFNNLCANPFIDVNDFSTYTEMNFKRLLGELHIKNKWSSHTYNRYRKNLKIFCDYLVKNNYLQNNPLKKILVRKTDKTLPKYLNPIQIKKLIRAIEETYDTTDFMTLRNKTILFFYMYTGCRLNELTKLKFSDIDFINGTIRINKGKGNKDRIIPLTYKLSDLIIQFELKKRKSKIQTEILFPTRFKGYMQHRDIYNLLEKVKEKLDFKLTPHMLRHTFATELVRKNINLFDISKILGHTNTKTTQIYLGLDVSNIKTNLDKISLYV